MMRKLGLSLITLLCLFLLSCSTPSRLDTSTEDELMDLESGSDTSSKTSESQVDSQSADNDRGDLAENDNDLNEEELENDLNENDLEKQNDNQIQAQDQPVLDEKSIEEDLQAEEPAPTPPPAPEPQLQASTPSPQQMVEIKNIKYLANQNGGSLVIESSGPVTFQVRHKPETQQFVVEIPSAHLPARLKQPYVLKEFGAGFASVNAYQNPGSTTARVVVQLKPGSSEPLVQQEGHDLIIMPASSSVENLAQKENTEHGESKQVDEDAVAADEKALGARSLDEYLTSSNRFYGRIISVEVQDQDVRDVLDFIAREVGLNMIMSEDVQGKISTKLRNVPWDQALVTIMKTKKLGYVRQGSVVRISTLAALQEENDAAKKILDSQKVLSPLRVKVIPVSYAAVEDLSKQIPPFLTPGRGQIVVDARTSSLILTDTEDVLERVARLVKELDIPPLQVMIEGKVVEALDSFSQNLGLNWSFSGLPMVIGPGKGAQGSDLSLFGNMGVSTIPKATAGVDAAPFGMNLSVGRFDFFGNISAALSMAESDSQIKILSSPRVVTMNKEKANISQKGQVISVQTIRDPTGGETQNAVRSDFSLELNVTPQITAEGSVIMDVEVKREFPGAVEESTTLARPINSRTAKTKILVNDGQTAVIGGIYSSDKTRKENGVPWLRSIPVLGWLFKSRKREDIRNELLIFLTPKVLNIKDQAVES